MLSLVKLLKLHSMPTNRYENSKINCILYQQTSTKIAKLGYKPTKKVRPLGALPGPICGAYRALKAPSCYFAGNPGKALWTLITSLRKFFLLT